jgi:hypothetical protein
MSLLEQETKKSTRAMAAGVSKLNMFFILLFLKMSREAI